MTKACTLCKETKSFDDFTVVTGTRRLQSRCKACQAFRARSQRITNPEIALARELKYRENHREQIRASAAEKCRRDRAERREYNRQYRERYPDRYHARKAVAKALNVGSLKIEPCEVCGAEKGIEAHHSFYSRPLYVRWLCHQHHMQYHRVATSY